MSQGKLEAIWIKRAHGGVLDGVTQANAVPGKGLVDDANFGAHREVTLIEREVFERHAAELGRSVDPATRRANLMVSGCALEETRGRTLEIGPVRILIQGHTAPCELMDESVPGLRAVMSDHWGGGAWGRILQGGELKVGDTVRWVDEHVPVEEETA